MTLLGVVLLVVGLATTFASVYSTAPSQPAHKGTVAVVPYGPEPRSINTGLLALACTIGAAGVSLLLLGGWA